MWVPGSIYNSLCFSHQIVTLGFLLGLYSCEEIIYIFSLIISLIVYICICLSLIYMYFLCFSCLLYISMRRIVLYICLTITIPFMIHGNVIHVSWGFLYIFLTIVLIDLLFMVLK